ncbi:unnamed protein product [Diatraea saccharalis]|uniref:Peptidase S1 domain-containing protein n=1 Tax=Diatraea saccharalis TaxID=40085 RepID=A0A9N9QTT5_9NEOP|nr:unnamed protein product [Diatraea saccharalis]
MNGKNGILRFLLLMILIYLHIDVITCDNVKKSVENDNREDNGDNDDSNVDSLDIPSDNETNNITCTRRQNSQMHEITAAKHKQFPFMAAIMSKQNEYLCSGSVVSNGLILTTATCTLLPTGYVLLNTTKGKNDETSVVLQVRKSEKYPTYTGSENDKNVGLLYTDKHNNSIASKIKLTNMSSVSSIVDFEGIGFGLNADVGQVKELQYVGMEHRSHYEPAEAMHAYFDCVETKVSTCYRDTGGPVIVNNELVGIVTKGQDDCTKEISSTYAINKKMADILPTFAFKAWLDEKIRKNEEQEQVSLATYPIKPDLRENIYKLTKSSEPLCHPPSLSVVIIMFVNLLLLL